ncbi:Centromere protein V [Diplodia seriata]|uniref:Centromere protein V n=1 Tax=Diplodia seriata TaxID=420778 RepID=A0A1S8BB05_9PEZI|nr:Centromere protein V [Diplodia seriata]
MGFPEPTDEWSQHSGHCHCGAVRFSFKLSPPLSKYPANSCNCSICTRNGYVIVYAQKTQFELQTPPDALSAYTFGLERSWHKFCKTCGSSVLIEVIPGKGPELIGVNVRAAACASGAELT